MYRLRPTCQQLHAEFIATSSHTGQGLDELARAIGRCLRAARGNRDANRGRHGRTVPRKRPPDRRSTGTSGANCGRRGGDELAGAEVRVALDELGKVVGAVYTDDLLDRVFSTFCIGK